MNSGIVLVFGRGPRLDKLVIKHIELSARIGVYAWEQECLQTLIVDLAFATHAQHIAEHDNIELAIDYDKVVQHLCAFVEQHHFQLIETLAEKMAASLLAHFPTTWVQITLHKPGALKQAKDVMIIIERSKIL